ncbi:MAG: hypothetical protein SGCHY_004423, partial [Lobulomycetales sp.]
KQDATDTSQVKVNQEEEAEETLFQLKLGNLPRRATKKVIVATVNEKVPLKDGTTLKIKKAPEWDHAILVLSSAQECERYREALAGADIKGSVIEAEALPPKKFKQRMKDRNRRADTVNDDRTPLEMLRDQITPLWKKEYQEQLDFKAHSVKKTIRKIGKLFDASSKNKDLSEERRSQLDWVYAGRTTNPFFGLQDPPVVPSDKQVGYRTKVEMTLGTDLEGKPTAGFLLGCYKDRVLAVGEHSMAINVSERAHAVASVLQSFLREKSKQPVWDRTAHSGFWRVVMIRTQEKGGVMAVVQVNESGIDPEEIKMEKQGLIDAFAATENIADTILWQNFEGGHSGIKDNVPFDILTGSGFVQDTLLNVRFNISPTSFFQVNSNVAEAMYGYVRDLCLAEESNSNLPKMLLDICCGTGTIGQLMASAFAKVIGIDIVESAITDARANAEANGITNVEYFAGKCEDLLQDVISAQVFGIQVDSQDSAAKKEGEGKVRRNPYHERQGIEPKYACTAILDPPRAGVNYKVIQAVRGLETVKRVIFIACDADKSSGNIFDLCRPTTNKFTGVPFKITKVQAFDMFPQTEQMEQVYLLER